MNCRIVFYAAKKTSYCEKALRKSVAGLGLNVSTALFATDGRALGEQLIEAFEDCGIVFVIGGLGFKDKRSIKAVMANAVGDQSLDDCKKLKNESGDDGYLLRAGDQVLVILPDDPDQLEAMLHGCLAGYLGVYVKSA